MGGDFPAVLHDLMKRNTAKSLFEPVIAAGAYRTLGITRQIEKKGVSFVLRLTNLLPALMALAKNRVAVSPTACLIRSGSEACNELLKTAGAHCEFENVCFNNLDTAWSEETSAPCRICFYAKPKRPATAVNAQDLPLKLGSGLVGKSQHY